MALTRHAESKILGLFYKGSQHVTLNKVYVGLYTTEITQEGEGVEVVTTDTGYKRQQVTFGDVTVDEEGYSVVSNTSVVDFGTATGDYGTVTHMGVFEAETGGNMLSYSECEKPKTILNGDSLRFSVGQLTIGLD